MNPADLLQADKLVAASAKALQHAKQLRQMLGPRAATTLTKAGGGDTRFVPPPLQVAVNEDESDATWGFADTRFEARADSSVVLTGNRYLLCGEPLPSLMPWIRGVMQLELRPDDKHPYAFPPQVPEPIRHAQFEATLAAFLTSDQISYDDRARLRRGHGHTQEEMYSIKYGSLPRVPDMVVYPANQEQVVALTQAAMAHNVVLIPYGGGTNVTDALRCPTGETRTICSVDLRRMCKVVWIDPVNRMACIEAGAVGRHILEILKAAGFTMGHEPDSVEFSTMGGWIATHASGMKKNKYGNIEDLLLDITAVTPQGVVQRTSAAPRESIGIDPRLWLLGSEGKLGIITSCVVKLFPLPQVQKYGSVLFPDFETGVGFMYELAQAGNWPASVRLMDNLQFQFGQALKPAAKGWKVHKSKAEKLFITQVQGFDVTKMTACTLVFEGSKRDVAAQEQLVYEIAKKYDGFAAGAENGQRGYQLTWGIAYIRDFVMDHFVIAESFETSVAWSKLVPLVENVKARILAEHKARGLPGAPFITARVTQIYDTGACVYFYFAFSYKGLADPTHTFHEVEDIARQEILRCGGSLSHHHGVGKLRQHFMDQVMSPAAIQMQNALKNAIDPQNIFGTGNQTAGRSAGDYI